jgi:hypothetical protein
MYFGQPAIESLSADFAAMAQRRDEVLDAFLARTYKVPRAQEFAEHGLSRRLKTMTRCIENLFGTLPPERDDLPSTDELTDSVVYIQAFIFNAFACLDNLAWIWVCEKRLTTEKGESIPPGKVGLGKKCRLVRRSLPGEFRTYLKSLDRWLDNLEDFRHALAHRIPLYIPPCVITEKDYPAYQMLEALKAKARRRGSLKKYEQFESKQKALMRYQPEMIHSISDNSKRIVFHPQLLSDFKTICELSLKMDAALNGEPATSVTRAAWASAFRIRQVLGHLWSVIAHRFVR